MSKHSIKLLAVFIAATCLILPSCNRSKALYLVPIGTFDGISMEELKRHYQQKFAINVEVLPLLPFDQTTFSSARRQLIAEELVSQIKRSYPKESTNKNAVIIGLTDGDMYIDKMNWQFAFGYRAENRFAVIATARMNPVNFREPADLKLLASRLRKNDYQKYRHPVLR